LGGGAIPCVYIIVFYRLSKTDILKFTRVAELIGGGGLAPLESVAPAKQMHINFQQN